MSKKKKLRRNKRREAIKQHMQAKKAVSIEKPENLNHKVQNIQQMIVSALNVIQAEPVKKIKVANVKPEYISRPEKVFLPPKGGVLTHISNFDEPYRGLPVHTTLVDVANMKRILRDVAFGYYKQIKNMSILGKIKLFLFRKQFIARIFIVLKALSMIIHPKRFRPERYCRFVREMYRVATLTIEKCNKPGQKEKMRLFRDLGCMVLELDNAYRYYTQDFFEELDFEKVKFTDEDRAYLNCRKDYKFKYKREVACPDGGVIEQKCKLGIESKEVPYNDLVAKFAEISKIEQLNDNETLEKIGVKEHIDKLKELSEDLKKKQQAHNDALDAKAKEQRMYIEKIKSMVKGQDKK